MSAAKRQRTCALCGVPFVEGERTDVEPLIDGVIRYLAVHPGHSTHPPPRARRAVGGTDGEDGTRSLSAAA